MGWLKYVVAGVGGAIVGGPLGAAAAIGVVKGASALMETAEDDEAKKSEIASEHKESVTEIVNIQEKREKHKKSSKARSRTTQNRISSKTLSLPLLSSPLVLRHQALTGICPRTKCASSDSSYMAFIQKNYLPR